MNRLVAVAMVGLVVALVAQLVAQHEPRWAPIVSLPLALVGIVTAVARTVPTAVRLGQGDFDEPGAASAAIRIIRVDHWVAFGTMSGALAVQLAGAAS